MENGGQMRNVHERQIAASAERVGTVLETLAGEDDQIWPGATWAPMVLDRGLEPGSRGGHDRIRYTVTAHEVGRRVEFTFDPGVGIDGTHTFSVVDAGDGTSVLRHVLEGRARGAMVLLWPLAVRWAHDAVVEDAFDLAEAALGVGPSTPARWSPWVRLLRTALRADTKAATVRQVQTPAELIRAAGLPRVDFTDTFALRLPSGSSRDVEDWHRALVASGSPVWVSALMAVRNQVARAWGWTPREPPATPRRSGSSRAPVTRSSSAPTTGTSTSARSCASSRTTCTSPPSCTSTTPSAGRTSPS
jgi:hypothetical protein